MMASAPPRIPVHVEVRRTGASISGTAEKPVSNDMIRERVHKLIATFPIIEDGVIEVSSTNVRWHKSYFWHGTSGVLKLRLISSPILIIPSLETCNRASVDWWTEFELQVCPTIRIVSANSAEIVIALLLPFQIVTSRVAEGALLCHGMETKRSSDCPFGKSVLLCTFTVVVIRLKVMGALTRM